MVAAYIQQIARSRNFIDSNKLADLLPSINKLSPATIDGIVEAYNGNLEAYGSFGLRGGKYGYEGLVHHLNRILGGKVYEIGDDRHTIQKIVARPRRAPR